VAALLREHILAVALEEFIRSGPAHASMERIAAAAKVSKRTLYTRFKSREGLLVAAARDALERNTRPIADGVPAGPTLEQVLHVTKRMLDISLTDEIIGLERLIEWATSEGLDLRAPLGRGRGTAIIEAILAGSRHEPEDRPFVAAHLLDTLVTLPRLRILRGEMANTASAKAEFYERTAAILAQGIPALLE
jgi:AcrR family transcriptional regulator